MDNYYTEGEAIKKLGIPKSTFYDLVKANQIPKVNVPSRKRAFYPRQRIDEMAEQRARILGEVAQAPERFVLSKMTWSNWWTLSACFFTNQL
jgi:predicted DNA-binding transcriptional regulator AlpA